MPIDGGSSRSAKIEALRKEYEAHERLAHDIAVELRRQQASKPLDRDAAQSSQLRQIVVKSFTSRNMLQLLELDAMEQRLKQARQTIEMRRRLVDPIIDRRVEDLLNPNLRWDLSARTSPPATEEMKATSRNSDQESSEYEVALWESLRAQQHQRDLLLTEITPMEMMLVDMRQPDEIPEDADPKSKERLEEAKTRDAKTATQLSDNIKSLGADLNNVELQIALLEKKLAEARDSGVASSLA